MEHYDGPAFFRRVPKKVEKKQPEHKVEVKSNSHVEYSRRNFHPSYIPPSTLSLKSTSLRKKYQQLIKEVEKQVDDFILFDDQSTLLGEITDLTQTKDQLTDENDVSENAQHDLINESDSDLSDHQEQTNVDEEVINHEDSIDPLDDEEQISEEQTSRAEDKTVTISNDQDNDMPEESFELSNEDPDSQTVDNESEYSDLTEENIQTVSDKNDDQDFASSTVEDEIQSKNYSKALNKSLNDIMNEENNAQRDLKIFDDPYTATTETKETTVKGYQLPPLSLLPAPVKEKDDQMEEWALNQAEILNETFKAFNVKAEVKNWTVGPTVTQFEVTLALGVKVNKITNLADDLKLALAAKDIRIEAPIAGKSSVGIEIPNRNSRPVMLSEVLDSPQFKNAKSPLTIALGVDLFGTPQITNIHDMPHGLIAGATGSGKSVFINSLLISLLYKATPQQVKLLLIDPKTVEMEPYSEIPHLLAPVISDPQAATASLKWAVEEMNQRYEKLAAAGVRDIDAFNAKAEETGEYGLHMPYIVIIIDELADLMMAASAEISDYISQITAKARACGIHLLVATQRPSVDVITGTMKNNIPTRIAFMVSSQVDSRTIIDTAGAEKLLGRGDMLYLGNGKSQPKRLQGTYINDDKIDEIVDYVKRQGKPQYAFDPDNLKRKELSHENEDELLPRVLDYIVNEETTSTSKLQRVFSIGYNRAARIIEELERKQYISPARGSKPRKVFLTQEELDKIRD